MATEEKNLKANRTSLLFTAIVFSTLFSYFSVMWLNVLPVAVSGFNSTIQQALFPFTIAISIVAASFILNKVEPVRITMFSLMAAVVVTPLILVIPWNDVRIFLIFSGGAFFSVGQLGVLTQFWRNSQTQKRGWLGGLIALVTLILFFATRVFLTEDRGFAFSIFVATSLAIVALATTLLNAKLHSKEVYLNIKGYYPEKRTVFLYFIPWVLFCLINGTIAKNLEVVSSQFVTFNFILLLTVQTLSSFIGALSGGIISDFFGRRLSLVFTISLYGLSMVFYGFSIDPIVRLFAYGIEGLSWGILVTLYVFVIWGDLSNTENSGKMYALGLAMYCVGLGFGALTIPQLGLVESALIACSIIFFSNLPIALAPELLPSQHRKMRKLEGYIRKVKKLSHDQN